MSRPTKPTQHRPRAAGGRFAPLESDGSLINQQSTSTSADFDQAEAARHSISDQWHPSHPASGPVFDADRASSFGDDTNVPLSDSHGFWATTLKLPIPAGPFMQLAQVFPMFVLRMDWLPTTAFPRRPVLPTALPRRLMSLKLTRFHGTKSQPTKLATTWLIFRHLCVHQIHLVHYTM